MQVSHRVVMADIGPRALVSLWKRIAPASVLGAAVALTAAIVVVGWLSREADLVGLPPGATMVLNIALCFLLVGLALIGDGFESAWRSRGRTAAGALVAAIAGLVLAEYLFGHGIGIDWPEQHRWIADNNPFPGRMSPPTAFAFLLSGATLLLMNRVRARGIGLLVQGLTLGITLVGTIGLTGYLLKFPLVYRNYLFGQMALSTAIGFIAAGTGLWLSWRRDAWYRDRRLMLREEWPIVTNGAIAMLLVVFVSWLATSTSTGRQVESLMKANLLEVLEQRSQLIRIDLELRSARAALVASRPALMDLLDRLQAHRDDGDALARLRETVQSFQPHGFNAMSIAGPDGTEWVRVGGFVDETAFRVPLRQDPTAFLIWDEGFVLRTLIPMVQNANVSGMMISEQRLPILTKGFHAADPSLAKGEIALCNQSNATFNCFPPTAEAKPYYVVASPTLSMAFALAGETGTRFAKDYRGIDVIAAFGPVGTSGLGMVAKLDTADLFAPLRDQMRVEIEVLAVLLAAGVALLYRSVAPLARGLSLSKTRLQLALDASRIALWDWSSRERHVYFSDEWERMLGRPAREVHLQLEDLFRIAHPEDRAALQKNLANTLSGKQQEYDIEHRVRAQDGHWVWIHSHGEVVERDGRGHAVRMVGTNVDISARRETESQLTHRATHDPLTGLPNRALFQDRLELALARARRSKALMVVMYIDLDKFKGINDTLGHDVGDALLKGFAARLTSGIRATDTAARLGGDEFAVVMEAFGTREDGLRVAEKIAAGVRPSFKVGEHTLQVTSSIGIAYFAGERGIDAERLLKMADNGLYQAKAAGRDCVRVGGAAGEPEVAAEGAGLSPSSSS